MQRGENRLDTSKTKKLIKTIEIKALKATTEEEEEKKRVERSPHKCSIFRYSLYWQQYLSVGTYAKPHPATWFAVVDPNQLLIYCY